MTSTARCRGWCLMVAVWRVIRLDGRVGAGEQRPCRWLAGVWQAARGGSVGGAIKRTDGRGVGEDHPGSGRKMHGGRQEGEGQERVEPRCEAIR